MPLPFPEPIDPRVDIGHVHLKVADLARALYLTDPDGNGVELYRDRAREEWPVTPDGSLAMTTSPLDLHELLAELADG